MERMCIKELFLLTDSQVDNPHIIIGIAQDVQANKDYLTDCLSNILVSRHFYIESKYNDLLTDLRLDKLIGRTFGQRGDKISGGEKNKIVMARFLLPEYGKYFIIDEPFTSLDAISEKNCMKVLGKYTEGMKGIIISHKMDIISSFADYIYVIENGSISERGTHLDLMNNKGVYNEIYTEYSNKMTCSDQSY